MSQCAVIKDTLLVPFFVFLSLYLVSTQVKDICLEQTQLTWSVLSTESMPSPLYHAPRIVTKWILKEHKTQARRWNGSSLVKERLDDSCWSFWKMKLWRTKLGSCTTLFMFFMAAGRCLQAPRAVCCCSFVGSLLIFYHEDSSVLLSVADKCPCCYREINSSNNEWSLISIQRNHYWSVVEES